MEGFDKQRKTPAVQTCRLDENEHKRMVQLQSCSWYTTQPSDSYNRSTGNTPCNHILGSLFVCGHSDLLLTSI